MSLYNTVLVEYTRMRKVKNEKNKKKKNKKE